MAINIDSIIEQAKKEAAELDQIGLDLDEMDKLMEGVDPFDVVMLRCPGCFTITRMMTADEIRSNHNGEKETVIEGVLNGDYIIRRPFHPVILGMIRDCKCPSPSQALPAAHPASEGTR